MTPEEAVKWLELLRTNPVTALAVLWLAWQFGRFARELAGRLKGIEEQVDRLVQVHITHPEGLPPDRRPLPGGRRSYDTPPRSAPPSGS